MIWLVGCIGRCLGVGMCGREKVWWRRKKAENRQITPAIQIVALVRDLAWQLSSASPPGRNGLHSVPR